MAEHSRLFADTNLFLRYLTNDVSEQAEQVERLFKRAAQGELSLYVHPLIIAEIIWTLDSHYHMQRDYICDAVVAIINTPGLQVEQADLILSALQWFGEKNIDFIDAFSGAWCLASGIDAAITFDRKHFYRLPGLNVLAPGDL